ncbi:A/G-specific adenine glycosylase [Bacterioplanes sanyensis]|uniref:Adenine DNA glycosylase n=1 Tax=Bacterioplanes sanyensis TaxID=1249553 RepID=A0A222FQK8_9GAMM|nr:A/G-specific adenine glycosylase [Bacterioplanes sanyensis]
MLAWYQQHGRKHLPWQQQITPYRVWVSEIMLQQTQVTTVIPYYERFMQRFPDVFSLAQAEQDEVLHLWTGLGYYARGRNLHACAKQVVEQYQGEFPQDLEALADLPGIGRSTAAAIASISMGMRAAIMDGNVKRVLTRFFAIEGWPGQTSVNKELWQLAESLTPEHSFREYTQVMMDLGATLCTRSKPACGICPLQPHCAGYASGEPTQYPHSKPKKAKPEKHTIMLIIQNSAGERWLLQRPTQGLWGGLWSFPEVDSEAEALILLRQQFGCEPESQQWLDGFRHTFSHYHLHIQPLLLTLPGTSQQIQQGSGHWYNSNKPAELGLAAPVKKLLTQI